MNVRTLRPFVLPALVQLRRLWMPFVAIQSLGLAAVLAFFYVPGVDRAFGRLAEWKAAGGVAFAAAALAFACGVVPEIFKAITGVDRRLTRDRLSFTLHGVVLFAVIGITADAFYSGLARTLGEGRSPGVVILKTAIDQFVWSPLVSLPIIVFSFTLRKHGYRVIAAARELGVAWYLREVVPTLVINLAYWVPMGLLMYTLPPTLVFVYSAMASAASATLITAIASSGKPRELDAAVAQVERDAGLTPPAADAAARR